MNICLRSFFVVLGMACACSYAQTDVALSGQLDSAVRYSSNASPAGASRVALGGAPDGNGIWRIRGREDLGDGMSAYFNLESAFQSANGAQVASSASPFYGLFGREASAGISAGAHSLVAGRLQGTGTAAAPLVLADPVNGAGYYIETLWPGEYVGLRFSNAVRYRYAAKGVSATLMHSFGGQPGSFGSASMNAVTLGYDAGVVKSMLGAQVIKDSRQNTMTTFTAGARIDILPQYTLHAAFMQSSAELGFDGIPNSGVIAPLPALLHEQTMRLYLVGLTLRINDAVTLKTAYYLGDSVGGTFIPSTGGGKIQTWYGVAEYALSRRSKLVAGVDYNRWTGGYAGYWGSSTESQTGINFHNGSDTRMNIALGFEHLF